MKHGRTHLLSRNTHTVCRTYHHDTSPFRPISSRAGRLGRSQSARARQCSASARSAQPASPPSLHHGLAGTKKTDLDYTLQPQADCGYSARWQAAKRRAELPYPQPAHPPFRGHGWDVAVAGVGRRVTAVPDRNDPWSSPCIMPRSMPGAERCKVGRQVAITRVGTAVAHRAGKVGSACCPGPRYCMHSAKPSLLVVGVGALQQ